MLTLANVGISRSFFACICIFTLVKYFISTKCLAELLCPLAQSSYTVNSTKDPMTKIKYEKIPEYHKMVSLEVKSLKTNL